MFVPQNAVIVGVRSGDVLVAFDIRLVESLGVCVIKEAEHDAKDGFNSWGGAGDLNDEDVVSI